MKKTIIINESMLNRLVTESEKQITDSDVKRIAKDTVKDALKNNKDLEKQVKEIVARSVNKLFLTLWQRHNFYEDEIKK